jgi:MFS family permease
VDRKSRRTFFILAIAFFAFAVGYTLFDLLAVHFEAIGLAKDRIGFILGFGSLGMLITMVPLAFRIDQVSRKKLLFIAFLAQIPLSFIYLIPFSNPDYYAVSRFFQGVFFIVVMISNMTILSHLLPSMERGKWMALFGVMGMLPFPLSIGIGELLYRTFGLTAIVALAVFFYLLALAALAFLPKDNPGKKHLLKLSDFKHALSNKAVLPLLVYTLLFSYVFGTFLVFLPGLVKSQGLELISPFWITYPIVTILIRLFGAGYFDRFPRSLTLLPGLISLPLSIGAILSPLGYTSLIISGIFYGISHAIVFPVLIVALIDLCPTQFRGRMNAIFNFCFSFGVLIAARLGGTLGTAFGARVIFTVAGFSGSGALVLWLGQRIMRIETKQNQQ